MDHLPTSKQAIRKDSTAVPFLCQRDYDYGPFLDYPTRSGMLPALSAGDIIPGRLPFLQHEKVHAMPKHEVEPLLQTWLFFGLIYELLGPNFKPQDFIRFSKDVDEQHKSLTTSSLVHELDQWVAQVQSKTIKSLPSYDRIAECLRLTYAVLGAVCPDFDPVMKLSLASLGEILTFSANKAFAIDVARENKCPLNWGRHVDAAYWRPRFLEAGWCISQTARMLVPGNNYLQTLHFLASLDQPGSDGIHQFCDEQRCLVNQTNVSNYQTRHTKRDCKCEELLVDSDSVFGILKTGSFPLLRLKESQNLDGISIDVVPSDGASQYVALSHVWADGLGNARRNALPRCQLSFLKSLITKLSTAAGQPVADLLFWCDTLCCPVQSKEAKDLALSQMRRTYEMASHVLVLDSSLRLYSAESFDHEELCSRVLSCSWMSRLWTLQEGVLARVGQRLWFQFQDEAVNSCVLEQNALRNLNSSVGRRGIASYTFSGIFSFGLFFQKGPDNLGVGIRAIDDALQGRAVSVEIDEPLVIGTLLGLDMSKIIDGPEESRIHRMWSLMPSATRGIPRDILFRVCPRLKESGFRWAPATMLNRSSRNMFLDTTSGDAGRGLPTPNGLLVRLPGFRIIIPSQRKGLPPNPWNIIDPRNQDRMSLRGEDGSWYILSRALPIENDNFLSDKTLRALLRDSINLEKPDLWITHAWPFFDDKGMRQSNLGLIVSLVKEHQNTKYARSELHITIGLQSCFGQELLEMAYQMVRHLSESLPAQQLAEFDQDEVNSAAPAWRSAFQALEFEMHSIARSQEVQEMLAKADYGSQEDSTNFLDQLIASIYAGEYGCLTERVSEEQQWCVN